jgi:hypothetical protein
MVISQRLSDLGAIVFQLEPLAKLRRAWARRRRSNRCRHRLRSAKKADPKRLGAQHGLSSAPVRRILSPKNATEAQHFATGCGEQLACKLLHLLDDAPFDRPVAPQTRNRGYRRHQERRRRRDSSAQIATQHSVCAARTSPSARGLRMALPVQCSRLFWAAARKKRRGRSAIPAAFS